MVSPIVPITAAAFLIKVVIRLGQYWVLSTRHPAAISFATPLSLSMSIYHHTYIFQVYISLFLGFKHFCVLCCVCSLLCEVRPSVRHELYSKTCTFAASLNLFVCLYKLQHKSCRRNCVPTIYKAGEEREHTQQSTQKCLKLRNNEIDLEGVRMMVYGRFKHFCVLCCAPFLSWFVC